MGPILYLQYTFYSHNVNFLEFNTLDNMYGNPNYSSRIKTKLYPGQSYLSPPSNHHYKNKFLIHSVLQNLSCFFSPLPLAQNILTYLMIIRFFWYIFSKKYCLESICTISFIYVQLLSKQINKQTCSRNYDYKIIFLGFI